MTNEQKIPRLVEVFGKITKIPGVRVINPDEALQRVNALYSAIPTWTVGVNVNAIADLSLEDLIKADIPEIKGKKSPFELTMAINGAVLSYIEKMAEYPTDNKWDGFSSEFWHGSTNHYCYSDPHITFKEDVVEKGNPDYRGLTRDLCIRLIERDNPQANLTYAEIDARNEEAERTAKRIEETEAEFRYSPPGL